jgi:hypothetical protein
MAYRKQPLTFQPRGTEAGGRQHFVAHVSGHRVVFGASGTVYGLLQFAGASPASQPQPDGLPDGRANYLVGAHPEDWRLDVPLFRRIKYTNLYPGIDLIYYGNENRLEYDLVVAPGGTWRSIRLALADTQSVRVDTNGDLRLRSGAGWILHGRPVVYQNVDGGRREVSGRYVLRGAHEVGFAIGAYDPSRPLIIDPTLAFASYLGGSGDDYGHAVAIDSSGCAYVVGETGSVNFPTLGPEQASMAGDTDVFVTKWNAAGNGVVYSTYIGGSNRDAAMGVTVDAGGNAYVTGFTYSGNFPITSGAQRTSFAGASKAFVLKLNPSGNDIIYSTFLGGSGNDYGAGIAVDAAGEAHIAGYTDSVDFPSAPNAFQRYYGGGSYDGFLAKLNATGSALIYATYLGGIANDTAAGVALDPFGNIYVTGQTQSANFPTANPLQATGSESDAFVVKMNASGQVMYSTYLGGTGLTNGTAIAADAAGNAYVTGFTDAPDFPVTANAYQAVNNGSYDAFVATINSYGSSILGATYLGGSGSDSSYAIALGGSGDIFIAGSTNSSNFPAYGATQPSYNGGGDAFVAAFNNQLTGLVYSTYFGGSGNDVAAGIAADSAADAYITGWTSSGESGVGLPITPGAFEPIGMGGIDAFLAKFAAGAAANGPPSVNIDVPASAAVLSGTTLVSGWAIDNTSAVGTAIGSVQVFVDGVLVGAAAYGGYRQDVCNAYPGRVGCPNVGFNYDLNTAVLSPGAHTITVYASDTDIPSPDTGSASVTVTVPGGPLSGPPSVNIDIPAPNAAVSGTTLVTGWAIDNTFAIGTAISPNSVQVKVDGYIYGMAAYGGDRADVCSAYPGRAGCPNVGFNFELNTAALSPGTHTIIVSATDSDHQTPDTGAASVEVTVGGPVPPSVNVDAPAPNTVISGTVLVTGWAIDNTTAIGTAINPNSVQVFVDGVPVGTAAYLGYRSDVCSAFPGRGGCPNVGFNFNLDTLTLTNSPHTITVWATNTDSSPDTGSASVNVTVLNAGPSVHIDAPAQNTAVSGTVLVTGWAIDNVSGVGTAINPNSMQVKVDDVLVGIATYGGYRADVCTAYPGRPGCPNVGYNFNLNSSGLTPGAHTITVYATDTDIVPDTGSASVTVNVP